jgi:hypothetical protein
VIQREEASIYAEVPGGLELLAYFGRTPAFGDAEILALCLDRDGTSTLRVHGWVVVDRAGEAKARERHAVVTFALDGIMDLKLDGFSVQNVIGGLTLRRAPDRPERRAYLALAPSPQDIEIELEPCYGLDGRIRARSVAITFQSGRPDADDT